MASSLRALNSNVFWKLTGRSRKPFADRKSVTKMNEVRQNSEIDEERKENSGEMGPPKFVPHAYSKEEIIIPDERVEDDYFYADDQVLQNGDGPVLCVREEGGKDFEEVEEDAENANEDALLAAWWNYKRANKQKKKKKKILEIYKDENYWTDGRYTDDEDFNYLES